MKVLYDSNKYLRLGWFASFIIKNVLLADSFVTMVEKTVSDKTEIPYATFPDDAPYPGEKSIMSVVCGNTHMHWAVHGGKKDKFAPILFWR